MYAFVVAIILFLVGGLFSLYEGFHKFTHPEELRDVQIAVAVLIAIGLEAILLPNGDAGGEQIPRWALPAALRA